MTLWDAHSLQFESLKYVLDANVSNANDLRACCCEGKGQPASSVNQDTRGNDYKFNRKYKQTPITQEVNKGNAT